MDDSRDPTSSRPAPRLRRFVDIATRVTELRPSCGAVRVVAVDGHGGAGKSTFAGRLATVLGGAPIVHTDDFASWENQFGWAQRLRTQVIDPLAQSRPARYQSYDWVARRFAEWHEVPVAPVLLIEGVGAAQLALADALAYVIWIDTPADLRLERGLLRDGEELREFWQQWIAGENRHFATDRTRERADLVVSGNPSAPHDPETECFAAEAEEA